MAKFRALKNSLIGGEIAFSALGRTDLPQYPHSCKTLKNMIPMLSGGAYRRPGTIYQDDFAASSYKVPHIIPFHGADGVEYAVVFLQGSPGKIYVYDSDSISSITLGLGAFIPATRYSVTNDSHPYTYADLKNIRYTQSGDVLFLVDGAHKPMILQKTAGPTFTFGEFDSTASTEAEKRDAWPYVRQNSTAVTVACSSAAVGSGRTLTVSTPTFVSGDVGSLVKIDVGGSIGAVKITAVPNQNTPQTVTVDVICSLGSTAATTSWWKSSWSDTLGWPKTIEFYRQRLAYAGTTTYPDSVWFSKKESFYEMSKSSVVNPDTDPTGNDAFTLTLAVGNRSDITWLKASQKLFVGTSASEWLISPEVDGSPFGGDNKAAIKQSDYGSNGVIAFTGNEIFFVSKDGTNLRSLAYSFYDQSYIADDVQVLFSDFPKDPSIDWTGVPWYSSRTFAQLAWDNTRSTLWCIDTAGNFTGLTRSKKLQINAWHSHQLGGYDAAVSPSSPSNAFEMSPTGSVLSVCSVLYRGNKQDDIWLAVKRKVNGSWKYVIETMRGTAITSDTILSQPLASQMVFTDCSTVHCTNLTAGPPPHTAPATYTVQLLEGESIVATTSNKEHGMFVLTGGTVSSGSVSDLDMKWSDLPDFPGSDTSKYWWLSFGLPFDSIVIPVRVEAGSVVGTAQGAVKRINKVTLRLFRTLSAKVGADVDRLQTIEFRLGSTPLNQSAELYSGDKTIDIDSDYERDGYIYITQDEPLPFGLCAIVVEGQTYD